MEFPPGFSQNFWLFGYGSLIWKPPPHFDKRVPGYIEGYVRRFWQARCVTLDELQSKLPHFKKLRWYSEDHRGTPEAPGRVVTLIERSHWESLTDHHNSTPPKVWGAAYHIPPEHVDEVRSYLDIREINGYSIQFTPIHPSPELIKSSTECTDPKPHISSAGSEPINCLVYIGLPNNPQFLGPQDPQALAEHIVRSKGPSGENKVYLYMLDDALNELSLDSGDEHVSDLARRCRKLDPEGMEGKATGHEGFKDE